MFFFSQNNNCVRLRIKLLLSDDRGEEVDAYAPASNAQRMLDFYRWSNNFRLHEGRTHKCDPQLNTDFIALKIGTIGEANAMKERKASRL